MNKDEINFLLKSIEPKIRKRGKDMYADGKISSYEITENEIFAIIESASDDDFYEVSLTFNEHDDFIDSQCNCAYFETEFEDCKHISAVAYLWLDIVNDKLKTKTIHLKEKENRKIVDNTDEFKEYIFNIKSLDYWALQYLVKKRLNSYNPNQLVENKDNKEISLAFDKKIVAKARYIATNQLALSCYCNSITEQHICGHVHALLEKAEQKFGKYYFNRYADFTKEKNAVLKNYGLTVSDKLADKFIFKFDTWGNLILDKKPDNILKLSDYDNWTSRLGELNPRYLNQLKSNLKKIPADTTAVGIAVLLGGKYSLPLWIEGVAVVQKKNVKTYKRIILNNEDDLAVFGHLDSEILAELEKLTGEGLLSFHKKTGYTYYTSLNSAFTNISTESINLIVNRITGVLNKLIALNNSDLLFFSVDAGLTLNNDNCKPVNFSTEGLTVEMKITKENNFWSIGPQIRANGKILKLKDGFNRVLPIIKIADTLFIIKNDQIKLFSMFSGGNIMVHEQETNAFFEKILDPFSKKYPVFFDKDINIEKIEGVDPLPVVYLSELNDSFLMIRPKLKYRDYEVEMDGSLNSVVTDEDKIYQIQRNNSAENEIIELIKNSHPRFKVQNNIDYFYLTFTEAMEKNWFLNFYELMQNLNIPVYGFKDLKKFKYNNNKPTLSVSSSSGIDWFDLQIEIHYGDEVVSLADLKKAILSNQQYILLKDGSLGMLPEEWIKKYSALFRMGQVEGDNLKVAKWHYTLLDELYEQIDDKKIQQELEQKKQNLHRIGTIEALDLPAGINATLRDYQYAGYQWMYQLKKLGWGGCLADDMGLGKTLQTLTFLQYCISQNNNDTHLIVCPTSLIYNWESEIQKFTPQLKYYIHYGTDRHLSEDKFVENNLIITSYGMVRSDIEHLNRFRFGYVILDESQAIKNPGAQITKAVQILKAGNRLILSGTPIQNNTFDLYAQLNFLNPGMLGNIDFFKSEFATPIDKYGDKIKSEELRKLIYPFLLRRTKEQVAKDLPDKTEVVLWCEMDAAQRKIYDYYKNYYRENLMQRIAEDGMGKSSIYILEGLLKLRQICDSPALLKDEQFKSESVKLNELLRELQDNTGNHKVLVFSQFVEMLTIIKDKLDHHNISYAYLDGSTPAMKRKEAVSKFQENDDIRIFLISLKAGGVGLNLTSADYVYLVDPWWNPAAEQQAIDRTHRIGQTNKVFAYKMICKDTVEEKILQLQQKKKALAVDLIAEEAGFVKKLTKDDVAFLFS